MDDKMYRLIWDETIRYEAFVKAANVEEAREAWGTGIEGQYLDSHTAIPMVLEA